MNQDPTPTDIVETEPALPLMRQPDKPAASAITPTQARVDAVAALTATALAKAATLQLTQDESTRLTAEFADGDFLPGAAGKENLLYLQHAALRDRMNSVLGLGQWATIVRESWNEDFVTKGNTSKGIQPQQGVRVYCRAMLLVRGCYVAEAVGDMDYFPGNAAQNYGDAFEGAKTAAFRRCAKEFGIGLQAWRKDWCEGWWQRKQGKPSGVTIQRPAPKPVTPPPTKPTPPAAPMTTAERRDKLLQAVASRAQEATAVFREEGLILPTETYVDIGEVTIERMSPNQTLALITTVKQRQAEMDQVPGAEVPDPAYADKAGPDGHPDEQPDNAIVGILETVTEKQGTGKNGKPFTKYGFKIGSEWFNSFSDTLAKVGHELKGQSVRYTFSESKWGKDLLTLEAQ